MHVVRESCASGRCLICSLELSGVQHMHMASAFRCVYYVNRSRT